MSPARPADPELDNLIHEITVDPHDLDEQLMGFEAAFDEDATFPCPGTIVGEDIEVLSVNAAIPAASRSQPANAPQGNTRSRCSTSASRPTQPPNGCWPHTAGGWAPEGDPNHELIPQHEGGRLSLSGRPPA